MTVLVSSVVSHTVPALALPDFETLYHSHVDALWRFLERLGVPERHLDDATQDTFVIVHRQLASFRGASSLNTWLHGIALRVAKDYRRREARKGGWQPLSPRLPDEARAPDESAAQRQQLTQVLQLLEQLDEAQRTAFVLVEFQGLTAPEVAEVTESNVNTVSTRLRAARLRFNELVAGLGEGR
jgi:RNA polymerase sigma-70 factor (ECF subfamily)